MTATIYNRQWWKRLRLLKLAQDPLCELCQRQGKATPATEVDHRTPIEQGGPARDYDNLASMCKPCHSAKTAAEQTGRLISGADVAGNPIDPKHPWLTA